MASSERSNGLLSGLRVLSFGQFIAGNTPPVLLAELGAEVVKIESFNRPEVLRTPSYAIGPPVTEPSGIPQTLMLSTMTRGVHNASLDLNTEPGRDVFRRLVAECDIVIENIAGSVLKRWECDFESVKHLNDRLVWLGISGFGRSGPRNGYLGYASAMSGYLGLSKAWGYGHGTHTDHFTANTALVATLAATIERERSDGPVFIDIGQIDAMATPNASIYLDPLNNGRDYLVPPNTRPGSWLSGVYAAAYHDTWVAVDIENRDDWKTLCEYLQVPDLDAETYDDASTKAEALSAVLAGWVSTRTPNAAFRALQKAGLAAANVQTVEDTSRDPQLHHRHYPVKHDHVSLGLRDYPGSAQRWTKTPGAVTSAGPLLGQHTHDVLRAWIGANDAELAEWEAAGAIFQA
ncbi:MAG: CaiB/BaiF CoA transferase family protein [Acidimicrobiia bacterium]